nr:MAG TPA: hypothetical protein [Caudoviricetes sp.]DAQ87364.1 MAG TPA: hypothetical protein [Caudoviricetes sp.]DAT79219.1 MAG TPA: hypothetical protein [Caudoviricetes sp.]DAU06573.1 MAG TPA: hypothetical protein [Caudoviricetes sp.]DAW54313.1 MAG TPA: hypothetical protein [Caudoviricetes sp.]
MITISFNFCSSLLILDRRRTMVSYGLFMFIFYILI